VAGRIGLGHTRWATHGRPSEANSHPHADCTGDLVVVHNGIIENYATLKERLLAEGHRFRSETDTEVIAHLLEEQLRAGHDLREACRATVAELRGAYAIAACRVPTRTRWWRPSWAQAAWWWGSAGTRPISRPISPPYFPTRETSSSSRTARWPGSRGPASNSRPSMGGAWNGALRINWDATMAQKGGYKHFMLKEIHEQPRAVADTLRGRLLVDGAAVSLPEAT
jgi:glucosamine--fructose-6-phosphate aminotransferase (isomerizing)